MQNFDCYIKPLPGECLETEITLPTIPLAMVSGKVLTPRGDPLSNALVLLLLKEDGTPILETLSDASGRFYLGPIQGDTLYTLRVQVCRMEKRILELTL